MKIFENWRAIAAVAQNGVIGDGLRIPWRIPEEFKHFKSTTMGGIVVMGRRTWESLGGKPLPGRENVVISSTLKSAEGAKVFAGLDGFANAYRADPRNVWICGGESLYKLALPLCSEIVLSVVKMSPKGDVFFPDFSADFEKKAVLLNAEKFDVYLYARKNPA